MGKDGEGLGTQDSEANTEMRYSAISRAESAAVTFEKMEGEHTPDTDLPRCHQVLEEGDKFESLILRFDRCCFLSLLRVDTHLLLTLWNAPRLPSRKRRPVVSEQLPHHRIQCTMGGKKVGIIEDEMG